MKNINWKNKTKTETENESAHARLMFRHFRKQTYKFLVKIGENCLNNVDFGADSAKYTQSKYSTMDFCWW